MFLGEQPGIAHRTQALRRGRIPRSGGNADGRSGATMLRGGMRDDGLAEAIRMQRLLAGCRVVLLTKVRRAHRPDGIRWFPRAPHEGDASNADSMDPTPQSLGQ